MPDLLLVETRDAAVAGSGSPLVGDAVSATEFYASIVLLLLDDAVTMALRGDEALTELTSRGGRIWVDDLSLAQRGLHPGDVAPQLAVATTVVGMGEVADVLLDDHATVVWHG